MMRVRVAAARDSGQVIPLFALFLVVLLGITALAIDVGNRYAAERFYRSVADGAALAGAQDLQKTTRVVDDADRTRARTDALAVLKDRLGATADPGCPQTADIVNCPLPGTSYLISIKATPLNILCETCTPSRAVQVTVRNPQFELSFARVFGMKAWDVTVSSVAGLQFSSKYALITLRPPDLLPNGSDQHKDDINLAGTNTRVNILEGDVGSNTYLVTNSASYLSLADGYTFDHYDDITPDGWNKDLAGNPQGAHVTSLIPDPQYVFPVRPADPGPDPDGVTRVYASQTDGLDAVISATTSCPGVPLGELPDGTECYKPGIYKSALTVGGTGPGAYLEPGAYFFDKGITVSSGASLWGGLETALPGVVIVVPQDMNGANKGFDGTSALNLILNRGDASCADDSCRAAPARDVNNNEIKTPEDLILTIMVPRDDSCFVGGGATPQLCSDNQHTAVKLAGNGSLTVAGVIYAPTDQSTVNGNQSVQTGVVGQIISWTVKYTGGSALNQSYPGGEEIGIVRLDAACTVEGQTVCKLP